MLVRFDHVASFIVNANQAPVASLVLSYGGLKLLPFWDPLRGDLRFEQIVASLAPKDAASPTK